MARKAKVTSEEAPGAVLVIPDVHEQIEPLRRVLASWGGPAILLGNLFDSFSSTTSSKRATVEWIAENSANPSLTLLWGNHDIQYTFPGCAGLRCSGYSLETQHLVDDSLFSQSHWSHWKLSTSLAGWDLSHAGVWNPIFLDEQFQAYQSRLLYRDGVVGPIFAAGRSRGGTAPNGGLTWLDWAKEFQPLAGRKQIVGHSPAGRPRWRGSNLCLDTNFETVAIIEPDGLVKVLPVGRFL